MGLFSAHGRLSRSTGPRWPIRLHSELSLAGAQRWVGAIPGRLKGAAVAAINDARVVTVLLVLAALALALEMAASFHVI
jgi:hypothetical protein